MQISYYKSATAQQKERDWDLVGYLIGVRDGLFQDEVLKYRALPPGDAKSEAKKRIAAVTPSGTFKTRDAGGLEVHSGFICIDIDEKDNQNLNREVLEQDKYVYALHHSVGGYGIAIYFKIDGNRHLDAFLGLEKYLGNKYGLICDASCKNVNRLRFVSYDPFLYKPEHEVPVFKEYLPKQKNETKTFIAHTSTDMDYIISQIRERHIDLTSSYYDWCQVGFAIANEYGEQGREYFHAISSVNPGYDEKKCDEKYTNLSKTATGRVSIATFFYMCKEAGISIQTEDTKRVVNMTALQKRQGFKSSEQIVSSVTKIAEIEGISPQLAFEVASQAVEVPESHLPKNKESNIIPEIKVALMEYNLKRNDITHEIEYKGKALTDTALNTIWQEIAMQLGPKANITLLDQLIRSDLTPSYNPFTEFFDKYKERRPKGVIKQLTDCIKHDTMINGEPFPNYAESYARKWLISIIASMHGTYSLMILVLCGKQGVGKTNFFRYLLPEELQQYYGESKLDRGKDDEILMCKKLILCDDEFSGKSKTEYKQLKQLASAQTFSLRQPYGRKFEDYTRYAVLCGTSNDTEVINDPTGNRRIIPINVVNIDWEKYKAIDKTDLFMECYWEYILEGDLAWQLQDGELDMLKDVTFMENEQVDNHEELINMCFELPTERKTGTKMQTTEIINYIMLHSKYTHLSSTRIGIALKKLGYKKTSERREGTPMKLWTVIRKLDYTP